MSAISTLHLLSEESMAAVSTNWFVRPLVDATPEFILRHAGVGRQVRCVTWWPVVSLPSVTTASFAISFIPFSISMT